MCYSPASYDISRQRTGKKKKASGDRKRGEQVSGSCEWGKQSYKVKGYTSTRKLGRNLIQKRDDEGCQLVFESPQFK